MRSLINEYKQIAAPSARHLCVRLVARWFAPYGQEKIPPTVMVGGISFSAETRGFEPPNPFQGYLISSEAHSTGLCDVSMELDKFSRKSKVAKGLTFDDVDGETTHRGLLIFGRHIGTGLAHGLDHGVERYLVNAGSVEGEAHGCDGCAGSDGVAFDARQLDETSDRVAG